MSIGIDEIKRSLGELGLVEPAFARSVEACGVPDERLAARGQAAMARIILGQQVSVASAAATFRRFEQLVGDPDDAAAILSRTDEELRGAGLSRQKISHVRSLAGLVAAGELDFDALPSDDEEAIAALVKVKGIGRWSAEVYLLIAESRPDIWPAGDLGVLIGLGIVLGLGERPVEKQAREMARAWSPYRSAAAMQCWHAYHSMPV